MNLLCLLILRALVTRVCVVERVARVAATTTLPSRKDSLGGGEQSSFWGSGNLCRRGVRLWRGRVNRLGGGRQYLPPGWMQGATLACWVIPRKRQRSQEGRSPLHCSCVRLEEKNDSENAEEKGKDLKKRPTFAFRTCTSRTLALSLT
ncbi:hypothetical protein B0H14DRAFT_2604232 [Mycena olivaceomarginata]|nr:hypothetical protein B0H14DRAFT_2604232 [Mycena olivaceomarginata]